MTSYEMVKGFSPMIREAIRTDRMPPYNADPHVGKFKDDNEPDRRPRSRRWSTGSRPARRAARAPIRWRREAASPPNGRWASRTCPRVPAFNVPASGVVDYQHPASPTRSPKTAGCAPPPSSRRPPGRAPRAVRLDAPDAAGGARLAKTRWRGSVGGYALGAESQRLAGRRRAPGCRPAARCASRCTTRPRQGRRPTTTQIGFYFC